jgi:hypothetical protein
VKELRAAKGMNGKDGIEGRAYPGYLIFCTLFSPYFHHINSLFISIFWCFGFIFVFGSLPLMITKKYCRCTLSISYFSCFIYIFPSYALYLISLVNFNNYLCLLILSPVHYFTLTTGLFRLISFHSCLVLSIDFLLSSY